MLKFSVKCVVACVMASVVLVGCSSTNGVLGKFDNGSLNYRTAQKLDPIKVPANQPTAPFLPLYNAPDRVDSAALPEFINESGKQYALPKPPNSVK